MSAPTPRTHRRAALTIIREHEPDPERCIAALVRVLTWQPTEAAQTNSDADEATPNPSASHTEVQRGDDTRNHSR